MTKPDLDALAYNLAVEVTTTRWEGLKALVEIIKRALQKLQQSHEAERADLDVLATVIRTGAVPPSSHEWTDDIYRKSALRAVELHRPRDLEESEMARAERNAAVAEALEMADRALSEAANDCRDDEKYYLHGLWKAREIIRSLAPRTDWVCPKGERK